MGLAAGAVLQMNLPRSDKRLLVILETDGCFADGVEVATGCSVGHRTLRVEDYGKVAATFVQVDTGKAIRLNPRHGVRETARRYAPGETRRYFAQIRGYQLMPATDLFSYREVELVRPVEEIVSRPGVRTNCAICAEEIINQREINLEMGPVCKTCAGPAYYRIVEFPMAPSPGLPALSDLLKNGRRP